MKFIMQPRNRDFEGTPHPKAKKEIIKRAEYWTIEVDDLSELLEIAGYYNSEISLNFNIHTDLPIIITDEEPYKGG